MPDKIRYDSQVTHQRKANTTPIVRPEPVIYKRQGAEEQNIATAQANTIPIVSTRATFNKIRYAPRSVFQKLGKLLSTPNLVADLSHYDDVIVSLKQNSNVYSPYFQRITNKLYQDAMLNYGDTRLYRYSEYAKMDSYSPEVSRALDAVANDATKKGVDGNVFTVKSSNGDVQRDLEDLFFKTLKLNSKGWHQIRGLAKYGDHFNFIIYDKTRGITNLIPVETFDIERQEGIDANNPFSYNFKMIAGGNYAINYAHYLGSPFYNNTQDTYENYQVLHCRLDGESKAMPYGVSLLEGARRIWRQLIIMEDSMVIHRLTRAPSRYKYTVMVGNMSVEDIPAYIEKYKTNLTRSVITDEQGNIDYRKSLLSMDENLFVPKRNKDDADDISIIDGLQWDAIEDVKYLHTKFLSGLGVPRAFLSFEENINAKNTLAQEDVRYAETVSRIQQAWIEAMTHLAVIHLFVKGYTAEEIDSFELIPNAPSEMLAQMKLQNLNSQAAVGTSLVSAGTHSLHYCQKELHNMSEDEIALEEAYKMRQKLAEYALTIAQTQGVIYTVEELLEISKEKKRTTPLVSLAGQGMMPGDMGAGGIMPPMGPDLSGDMDAMSSMGLGADLGTDSVAPSSPMMNNSAMPSMGGTSTAPTMSGEQWLKKSIKQKELFNETYSIYDKSVSRVINNFVKERISQND